MANAYFAGPIKVLAPTACVADITPPTFAGITSLTQNTDGSLQCAWSAATDVSNPISYEVYIQATTAVGLFSVTPKLSRGLSLRIFLDSFDTVLNPGTTYFVGVRAVDALGNKDSNTVSQSIVVSNANFNSLAGSVWDVLRSVHTTPGTYGEALQSKVDVDVSTRAPASTALSSATWTNTRAALLDLLDVAISTRAAAATALSTAIWSNSRASNLDNLDVLVSSRASQTSVNNIQNNTDFVGIVQTPLILPVSGSKSYPFYVRLFSENNSPIDPDSNLMNYTIKDASGGVVVAQTAMTRTGVGLYEATYTVLSTDTERALYFFFDYAKSGVNFNQVRTTEVQEFESKLDILLARLTNTRATLLDNLVNLDAAITSRSSQSTLDTYFGNMSSLVTQLTNDIALIQNITNNSALIGGRSLVLTQKSLIMDVIIDPQLIP